MSDSVRNTYTIGIDEAGRGPIAGPVAVGGCMISNLALDVLSKELIECFMRGKLKDSKKLSEKKREEIFAWMQEQEAKGALRFAVSMGSAQTIDTEGIVPTIAKALSVVLTRLAKGQEGDVRVLLDGGLTAPEAFAQQETIIRGDEREVSISLASIAAKVTRDAYMKDLEARLLRAGKGAYGFDRHKGYGTKAHYEAIDQYGLCEEHRRSFCKSIIN